MPRERQDIFRESNTQEKGKIIVLAFEGNNTERIYFEELKSDSQFNDELIYLHLLSRVKGDTKSAPKYVFDKLKREAKGEYNFDQTDELWMIIDTDAWKINEIVELCKEEENIFVAVSNPCFEIWLILHIKDLSNIDADEKRDILENRKISNSKRFIDKYLGELLSDGYNKSRPKPSRFLPHIRTAVERAKMLDLKAEEFPSDIGSHVYKIAEKILKIKNKLN